MTKAREWTDVKQIVYEWTDASSSTIIFCSEPLRHVIEHSAYKDALDMAKRLAKIFELTLKSGHSESRRLSLAALAEYEAFKSGHSHDR